MKISFFKIHTTKLFPINAQYDFILSDYIMGNVHDYALLGSYQNEILGKF